jgi:hypothetical protein
MAGVRVYGLNRGRAEALTRPPTKENFRLAFPVNRSLLPDQFPRIFLCPSLSTWGERTYIKNAKGVFLIIHVVISI